MSVCVCLDTMYRGTLCDVCVCQCAHCVLGILVYTPRLFLLDMGGGGEDGGGVNGVSFYHLPLPPALC